MYSGTVDRAPVLGELTWAVLAVQGGGNEDLD